MSSEAYERALIRRFLCWLGFHITETHVSGYFGVCIHCRKDVWLGW